MIDLRPFNSLFFFFFFLLRHSFPPNGGYGLVSDPKVASLFSVELFCDDTGL